MATGVRVTARVLDKMREDARASLPFECCGLLSGQERDQEGLITEIFPTTNASAAVNEFFIPPEELIVVFRTLRQRGQKLLGIYHSHPQGENVPSRRDIEMAFYPACAYFILSPRALRERHIRAFEIVDGKVTELTIEVLSGSS